MSEHDASEGVLNPHDPVPSIGLDAFLERRAGIAERADRIDGLLAEIRDLAADGFGDNWARMPNYCLLTDGVAKHIKRHADAQGWGHLMKQTGLRSLMDNDARTEWDKNVHEAKTPELTRENVLATFERLHATQDDMFERGVLKVFKGLSWDYKTNSPCKFGNRIIIEHFIGYERKFGFWNPSSYSVNRLVDLERCLTVLDGQPAPDHRHDVSRAVHEVVSKREVGQTCEVPMMRLKWFKKGTCHVEFKRMDLVEKMNRILAKHHPDALPARL